MFGRKKPDLFGVLFPADAPPSPAPAPAVEQERSVPQVSVDDLPGPVASPIGNGSWMFRWHDGEKFAGGFGATQILTVDYWTLRARSAQLWRTNLYARGLIKRLVTNEINTGLHLEAVPVESVLGYAPRGLADWAEDVENRFALWAKHAPLCDFRGSATFGALQRAARMEALISGDVLVVLRQDRATGMPRIQLVSGSAVQTPMGHLNANIRHGVELDEHGRHVAYWVRSDDGTSTRLPAYGPKTKRRQAWLVYGTPQRLDDVRGEPILSLVLQSLREIDRYRDSVQRKAVMTSVLALVVEKDADKPGVQPVGGGAVRRGVDRVVTDDGRPRTFNVAEMLPGTVVDELQTGEKIKPVSAQGTDEKFGDFEAAILRAIAWSNEIPPEIFILGFTNNYSASQAALNEFKLYLLLARTVFGETFCEPVYEEWLVSAALSGRVRAPGMLDAWREPARYEEYCAWVSSEWAGQIKPTTDVLKQVKGLELAIALGLTTRDRAAREFNGSKYTKNVATLVLENEMLAKAKAALPEPRSRELPAPADDEPDDDDEEDDEEAA